MNDASYPDTTKVLLSILLGFVGLYLLLAISTYSPFDPGWTYTASDTQHISNLGGMVGAWIADVLRAGLGWASFLVPFYLCYEVWQLWKPRTVLPRAWRFFAQAFMIVMLASLFALIRSEHSLNYAGGVIGYEVSTAIAHVFTVYGAGILFVALLILACNLIFVINWKKIWFNINIAIEFIKDTLYRSQQKQEKSATNSQQIPTHEEISTEPVHQHQPTTATMASTIAMPSHDVLNQADTPSQLHTPSHDTAIGTENVHIHTANVYVTGDVGYRADTAQTHLQEIQQLLAQSKTQPTSTIKKETISQHTTSSHYSEPVRSTETATVSSLSLHAEPAKTDWQDNQSFNQLLNDLEQKIQASSSAIHQKADTQDIDRRIHELNQQIEALQQSKKESQQAIAQDSVAHIPTVQTTTHSLYDTSTTPVHHEQNDAMYQNTLASTPITQETSINTHDVEYPVETQTTSQPEQPAPPVKESKLQNLLDMVLAKRAKQKNNSTAEATANVEMTTKDTDPVSTPTLTVDIPVAETTKHQPLSEQMIESTETAMPLTSTNTAPTAHFFDELSLQHQQLKQRLTQNTLHDLEQMLLLSELQKSSKSSRTRKSSASQNQSPSTENSQRFTADLEATTHYHQQNTTSPSWLNDDGFDNSISMKTENHHQTVYSSHQNDWLNTQAKEEQYSYSSKQELSYQNTDDDDDWDAPLTDSHGRVISRAMQVAQYRKDLPALPSIDLLDKVDVNKKVSFSEEQLGYLSQLLELKLQDFNIKAQVKEVQPGPVVTRFALELAPGVKAAKVTSIAQDLARSMSMSSIRVVQVIPGKPYIGIEVPNSTREMVRLIELVDTPEFRDPKALLSMAMGKDIAGHPVLTDLAKAPHMLVAGTTGSGKSVAVNSMLLSMLLKYTPQQLRLLLIDPKQLELANYDEIPHLLTPVVTDMKDATNALHWCVKEMERRYSLMTAFKVRKINDFNEKITQAIENGEDIIDPLWKPDQSMREKAPRLQPLPMIVIVADEFADMIMQVGKKAEEMITRLAQKSRAAGIHLLLATQRPSVDVITGLIKANIPTRVALRVNSKIDSRTILDAGGAEDLLGHGDMLFLAPGKNEPERLHGAFIADDEVNRICDAWRERGSPDYVADILDSDEDDEKSGNASFDDEQIQDVLYDKAVEFVLRTRKASASSLQRQFNIGFNRAANLMDAMERNGIVSESQGSNRREILI